MTRSLAITAIALSAVAISFSLHDHMRSAQAPATPVAISAPAAPALAKGRDFYLAALRNAGTPISTTGNSEVLIAQGVCAQLAAGADRTKLVNDLNATFAPLRGAQGYYDAVAMVDSARQYYC